MKHLAIVLLWILDKNDLCFGNHTDLVCEHDVMHRKGFSHHCCWQSGEIAAHVQMHEHLSVSRYSSLPKLIKKHAPVFHFQHIADDWFFSHIVSVKNIFPYFVFCGAILWIVIIFLSECVSFFPHSKYSVYCISAHSSPTLHQLWGVIKKPDFLQICKSASYFVLSHKLQ